MPIPVAALRRGEAWRTGQGAERVRAREASDFVLTNLASEPSRVVDKMDRAVGILRRAVGQIPRELRGREFAAGSIQERDEVLRRESRRVGRCPFSGGSAGIRSAFFPVNASHRFTITSQ